MPHHPGRQYHAIRKHPLTALAVTVLSFAAPPAAARSMTQAQAAAIVAPVYRALTATSPAEIEPLLDQVTAADWQNCTGDEACQSRSATIKRWSGRISNIPNYHLDQKMLLVSGSHIIVRGEATGTPAVPFLGVQPTGRSFRIMTIDIYDVKDGKIIRSFHVEDWATAMRQLSPP